MVSVEKTNEFRPAFVCCNTFLAGRGSVHRPFGTTKSCDLHCLQTPVVQQLTNSSVYRPALSTVEELHVSEYGRQIDFVPTTFRFRFRNVCLCLVGKLVVGNMAAGIGRLNGKIPNNLPCTRSVNEKKSSLPLYDTRGCVRAERDGRLLRPAD